MEYNAAMSRRFLRCWLALVALAILPACAATTSPVSSGSSPESGNRQSTSNVNLTVWHSWSGSRQDALNSLARAYEQSHPHVRLRLEAQPGTSMLQRYSTNVADDSAPQLLMIKGRYIGELAERQYITPLSDMWGKTPPQGILPETLVFGRVGNELYGVPVALDPLVLFYNRRQVTAPPATMDETINLNAAQRDLPPEQRPWSLGYYLSLERTLPYLSAFGGTVVGQDGAPVFAAEGKDATQRWLDWLTQLQSNEHVRASLDFSAVDSAVRENRVLSVIDWAHRRADYAQIWGADAVGIAPLPAIGPDAVPKTFVVPDVVCVNTVISREQRAVALDFLRFMTEQTSQDLLWKRGQLVPVHQQVEVGVDAQPLVEAARNAQSLTSPLTARAVWGPLSDMLRSVMSRTATPAEAIDAAGAAVQKPTP